MNQKPGVNGRMLTICIVLWFVIVGAFLCSRESNCQTGCWPNDCYNSSHCGAGCVCLKQGMSLRGKCVSR